MEKGDKVKIYQDPESCGTFEGEATLLRSLDNGTCTQEYWMVEFDDGYRVPRWVNVGNH